MTLAEAVALVEVSASECLAVAGRCRRLWPEFGGHNCVYDLRAVGEPVRPRWQADDEK